MVEMADEKLTVKSTDLLVLHTEDSPLDLIPIAQALHEETGALVLILGPGESVESLLEDEAKRLWEILHRRFGGG